MKFDLKSELNLPKRKKYFEELSLKSLKEELAFYKEVIEFYSSIHKCAEESLYEKFAIRRKKCL